MNAPITLSTKNFQRKTSIKKLEESLGRLPTDDEIEKAKQVPFSVDFIFCNDCENIFTSIESNFMDIILPKFRNSDLSKIESLSFSETKLIRLFFYIQIWRSSICEEIIDLSKSVSESLRQIILNRESISDLDLKDFPLTITYLETTGDRREYTTNVVGFTNDTNPLLIFMNDFIIQFFEYNETIRFLDFFGLNTVDNYEKFINFEESEFKINIIHNADRKEFFNKLMIEKANQTLHFYNDSFKKVWLRIFGWNPSTQIIQEYFNEIIGNDKLEILQYSEERIFALTRQFIIRKLKKLQ